MRRNLPLDEAEISSGTSFGGTTINGSAAADEIVSSDDGLDLSGVTLSNVATVNLDTGNDTVGVTLTINPTTNLGGAAIAIAVVSELIVCVLLYLLMRRSFGEHVGLLAALFYALFYAGIAAAGNEVWLWPMPDVSRPPLHALDREALMAKLDTFTNLRLVADESSPTGYRTRVRPFPGWETGPSW